MSNYLTKFGKQEVARDIMSAIGGRSDLGAVSIAEVLAKKLSSHELELFLHVARNPAPKQQKGLGEG